jgi:predicted esterase
MKKILTLCVLMLGFGLVFCQGQDNKTEFTNYSEMRKHLGELFQQKKYKEAAELLESVLDRFPGHIEANTYNLALAYGFLKEYEKGTDALLYGLEHGIFFNRYAFGNKLFAPFKELKKFSRFLDMNEIKIKEAQKNTKYELSIVTPEGYTKEKKYPLFIALHGGSGNNEGFKQVWKSEKLENEFIVAFIQSSQVVSMAGFTWEDHELSRKEVREAYLRVIEEYPVNTEEVIIGGFSAGGAATLEIILNDSIPVEGFVVLCPPKTESFTEENIKEANKRGLRGTILTTEMDPRLPEQKEMVKVFEAEAFPHKFVVTPDIGHWIPKDLNIQIDEAIEHIRNK